MKLPRCSRPGVIRHALLVALVASFAGCGLGTRPASVKQTYLLQPPPPARAAAPVHAGTLKVGMIAVAAPFRGRSFVYREEELKYESDFYNEFFVAPAAMLTADVGAWLSAAGIFREVLPASANADGDFVLEGLVSEIYGDYRDAAKPAAVLSAKFFLIDNRGLGGVPVWQTELRQRVALPARSPDALAAAYNSAWSAMLADLSRDLAAAKLAR
jgi:cholesterol transport system auxiliary component